MSKLYTEEQLRKAWNTAYVDALALDNEDYKPIFYNDFIASLTPIQLPTDEEVYQEAKSKGGLFVNWNMYETSAFVMGAQWMRDKIKGGQE